MITARTLTRLARLEAQLAVLTGQVPVPSAVDLMRASGLEPDPWQVQVLTSPAERRLLLCCRQSGKTQTAAAAALSTALRQPGSLTLILAPSLRQAQESFRRVLALYRTMAQPMPTEAESALRLELANGSRIVSLPGTESTIRGYAKVALLIVDEAARVADELYYAVRPMLAVSGGSGGGGKLLALSTPYGKRGWFYDEYTHGEGWERTTIRAAQCPRISAEFLAEERRALPRLWYEAEYECVFSAVVDAVFRDDDLDEVFAQNVPPLFPEGFPDGHPLAHWSRPRETA